VDDIQRYGQERGDLVEKAGGDWVSYEDHRAALVPFARKGE